MKTLYKLLRNLLWRVSDRMEEKGKFTYGNCIIRYSFRDNGDTIEVYNPIKDIYLDNIAEWLLLNLPDRAEETSEYDNHGFRSEADYLNYKYG